MNSVPRRTQQGFLLITVIMLLGVLAAIALMLSGSTSLDNALVANHKEGATLDYVLESGLEHAKWRLSQNSACTGFTDLPTTVFGANSYGASYSVSSGSPLAITASGSVPSGATRALVANSVKAYQAPQPTMLQPGSEGLDVWFTSGKTNWNYGAHATLNINSSTQRALVQFDLASLPADVRVTSASLELYAKTLTGAGVVDVHRVSNAWVEGSCTGAGCTADGATWDTSDGTALWSTAGADHDVAPLASQTIGTAGAWYTWDIRFLAASWVSGELPNHGVLLIGGTGVVSKFSSSDEVDASLHPKLTISYACECGVQCTSLVEGSTYRDEFSSRNCAVADYTGSDGTLDWSPWAWAEVSDDGASCVGDVEIEEDQDGIDPGNFRLKVGQSGNAAVRQADLSMFTSAYLSFDYRRRVNGSNYVTVDIWDDNASAWIELDRFLSATDFSYGNISYDISGYMSPSTQIRFFTSGLGVSEYIYIDNVQIGNTAPVGSGPSCTADFVADTKESEFDTEELDIEDPWGITFLPPGTVFDSISAPSDGAWLMVEGSDNIFVMTDMSGNELTTVAIAPSEPRGVALVNSGTWANHLALSNPGDMQVYFIDLDAVAQGSFSTASFTENPVGATFIENSAGGTYDGHLAISSDEDGSGSSVAGIYIVDQGGSLQLAIDISGFATEPWGIAHIPEHDKFLVIDESGVVFIVGFDGSLLDQYSAASFGAGQPQSIAINTLTSAHAVLDIDSEKLLILTLSTCGDEPPSGNRFRDEFKNISYSGSDGTLNWSSDWLEINENDGASSGDERVLSDSSNYQLRVRDNDGGGEGIQREADLSSCGSASLAFDYRRNGLDTSGDYITVDVSANGGSSWVELDRLAGPADDSGYQSISYDISAYLATNTRIRFLTSSLLGGSDELFIDNVDIDCPE